jgi:hypothetical protein
MEQPKATNQWDAYAERLRVQLPAAPDSLTIPYMQWAPWIAIVFGALGVLLTLGGLFLGAILGPFLLLAGVHGINAGAAAFVALVVLGLSSAVDVVGGYLMRQQLLTGWWLVAVGLILSAVYALLSGNAFSLVFTLLIAYIHLAVKPSYR